MKNLNVNQTLTILSLIAFAALTRILPHPWNTTAIGALALFSGSVISSRFVSIAVTLAALFVTDLILGFHGTMPFVYGAFAVITIFSSYYLRLRGVTHVVGASLFASLFFYLFSNFGVWFTSGFYPKTTQGLMTCYLAGLPFLNNQIFGDLFYSALIFGAYALCEKVFGFRQAQERL